MNKKTFGAQLVDHNKLNLEVEDDVIEYRRKLESDVIKQIDGVIDNALKQPQYKLKDFYIVLLTKIERIGGTPRNYILARLSCPTPVYRQSVWKYHHVGGSLEFLWSIPDSILYHHILSQQEQYMADKECADLAKFVILMESGELLEWVKRENGEKKDAVININKEPVC